MMPAANLPDSPYARGARLYWEAGWRGILPLPPAAKKPVPTGWTGRDGAWPSWADIFAWAEDRHDANLALRMPHHVIGVDVDAYDGKQGAATLAEAEQRWGELPPTWRSTSRDDGVSGIRVYRIPDDLAWPGEVGPDIEIIRWCHRYTVAWPSTHPEGRTYRWIGPDGVDRIGDVPQVDELPDLPDTWTTGLTSGETDHGLPKADLDNAAANTWILDRGNGRPCRATQRALDRYLHDLDHATGSRHDATMHGQRRITALAAEGHTGAVEALSKLYTAFIQQATRPGKDQRSHDEAQAEWQRGFAGAIRLAAAQTESDGDPCEAPFAGLVARNHHTNPSVPDPLPGPPQPAAPEPDGEPAQRERSSWWPVDLEAALTGDNPEPAPAHLVRSDGQALVYPAKVNGIIGESESGKTWVALLAVQQAMGDSVNVTYIDFEDTSSGIVDRLLTMGVDPDQIRTRLAYISPDHFLDAVGADDLTEHLDTWQPGLVVVDGVNAAMTLLSLDLLSNTDATRFAQTMLRPIAARGAAVLYVDHTPKAKDSDTKGGIGAQAKRAMTTGAAFKVETVKAFGKGQDGKLRMRVDKDRPGYVRGASLPGKAGHWAGDVNIACQPDGRLTIAVAAPGEHREPGQFRPTKLMERVSAFISKLPDAASKNAIEKEINGNTEAKRAAIQALVADGYAAFETGARGAILVRHIKLYSELHDLTSPTSPDLAHTSPMEARRSPAGDFASSPPPLRGRGEVAASHGEDRNGSSSPTSPTGEVQACRACGTIPERGQDILVAGRCKDCRLAGREAVP